LLIDDPKDLAAYGESVLSLLNDEGRSFEIGQKARDRVRDGFLGARSLIQYVNLFDELLT
jgi:hypothetical protein